MRKFILTVFSLFLFVGMRASAPDVDIGQTVQQESIIQIEQADAISINLLDHATGRVEYVSVLRVVPVPDMLWFTSYKIDKFTLLPNNYITISGNTTLNPNDKLIGEPINFT